MGNHEIGKNHQLRSSNIKHEIFLTNKLPIEKKTTTFNHIVAVMARNHLKFYVMTCDLKKKAAFKGML